MHRFRYLIGCLTLVLAVVGAVWVVRVLRHLDERPGLPLQVEFRDAAPARGGTNGNGRIEVRKLKAVRGARSEVWVS